ncbi:MAG: sulfur carrier protein ThiS [Akkermansiaceae bacterium]
MTIIVNGNEHQLETGSKIRDLLETLNLSEKPVVVEHNKAALFPREYDLTDLNEGDNIEIITIAAGG